MCRCPRSRKSAAPPDDRPQPKESGTSMLRSLFSGISGLRAHQQMMDVTGNNISNINTTGFKASQATFEDTLSQMVRAGGAPQAGNGGTNPAPVSLCERLCGYLNHLSQGHAQTTRRHPHPTRRGARLL